MSTRRVALKALSDIADKGAYANLCLKNAVDGLDERDSKWVVAAVYTTLDNLLLIDHIIAAYAKGKLDKSIKNILRLGVCQAKFMNVPASAACNESVKLAKEIGKGALGGYVNGVMRAVCKSEDLPPLPDEPAKRLSIEHSWPLWLIEEFIANYGITETTDIISGGKHSFTIRSQWPYTAGELEAALKGKGVEYAKGKLCKDAFCLESGFDVEKESLFTDGKITVQSESAMLVCKLLDPRANMKVLDCCCAPGGKTAYMASLMENRGSILGFELHPHRAKLCEKTFKRLHIDCCAGIECKDATEPCDEYVKAFDAVLVDAPCSGLGVRGKPDVRYAKTAEMLDELCGIQRKILDNCSRYVKPGGVLVYSTCTVSKRENECVCQDFLLSHKDFYAADISTYLPDYMHDRIHNGGIQLLPGKDDAEGFYMVKFIRRG